MVDRYTMSVDAWYNIDPSVRGTPDDNGQWVRFDDFDREETAWGEKVAELETEVSKLVRDLAAEREAREVQASMLATFGSALAAEREAREKAEKMQEIFRLNKNEYMRMAYKAEDKLIAEREARERAERNSRVHEMRANGAEQAVARWQHGEMIEGDYVTAEMTVVADPYIRAERAEAEVKHLRGMGAYWCPTCDMFPGIDIEIKNGICPKCGTGCRPWTKGHMIELERVVDENQKLKAEVKRLSARVAEAEAQHQRACSESLEDNRARVKLEAEVERLRCALNFIHGAMIDEGCEERFHNGIRFAGVDLESTSAAKSLAEKRKRGEG